MSTDRLKEAIARGNIEFMDFITYDLIYGAPHEYYSILYDAIKIEAKKYEYYRLRQIVLHLIKCGIDEHFKLKGKIPLLVHALKCGSSHEVIAELIKKGSDVNVVSEEGYTPLFYALQMNSDSKVVHELISNGADVNYLDLFGRTALFSVNSNFKNPEIIKIFVNAGASVNEHYEDGRNILMLDLCKCIFNKSCIFKETVDICINKGVNLKDIDKNGNNVLHYTNCSYLIDMAVWNGVCLEEKNNLGQTALMQAVMKCNNNKIQYLLLCGANVNCVDDGLNTPLHVIGSVTDFFNPFSSCTFNSVLYHGGNLFACNRANCTPLDNFGLRFLFYNLFIREIVKYILLFDENSFKIVKDIFEKYFSFRIESKVIHEFPIDCIQELGKIKSTWIKDDMTFYEFCILREFYKNKCIDIAVDDYEYSYKEIRYLFPIYKDIIIFRIKDNKRKKFELNLLKYFEHISLKPHSCTDIDVELNYDCLHHVSGYLNLKDRYNLFSAAVID